MVHLRTFCRSKLKSSLQQTMKFYHSRWDGEERFQRVEGQKHFLFYIHQPQPHSWGGQFAIHIRFLFLRGSNVYLTGIINVFCKDWKLNNNKNETKFHFFGHVFTIGQPVCWCRSPTSDQPRPKKKNENKFLKEKKKQYGDALWNDKN